jgi:hypothetical protein
MNKLASRRGARPVRRRLLVSVVAQDAAQARCCGPGQAASAPAAAASEPLVCFEGRKGASEVTQRELQPGLPNVKCSPTTGAALWYGDPLRRHQAHGQDAASWTRPAKANAVVKPRSEKLASWPSAAPPATTARYPKGYPKDNKPVPIPTMEAMMPELAKTSSTAAAPHLVPGLPPRHQARQAGRPLRRPLISFDQPQAVRQVPRRQAARLARRHPRQAHRRLHQHRQEALVHLHRVPQPAQRAGRHAQPRLRAAQPEPPPQLPRGMKDARHEKLHPIPH